MLIFNSLNGFVPVTMILCGLWSFTVGRKHLLNTWSSLEFIKLGIFFCLSFFLPVCGKEIDFVLFFLTTLVCEGALGSSVLVAIVRTHGNDYYNSFSVLQC